MRITPELDTYYVTKDGTYPVKLVLFSRTRSRYTVPDVRVAKEAWDSRRCKVRFGTTNSALLNDRIDKEILRAEAIVLKNAGISPSALRDMLKRPDVTGKTFREAALMDLQLAPPKSEHTVLKRRKVIERFAGWAGAIGTEQINGVMVEQYRYHLTKTGLSHNSVAGELKVLRTIYRRMCRLAGVPKLDILEGLDVVERYTEIPSQYNAEEVLALIEYVKTCKPGTWAAKSVHFWLASFLSCGIRWGDLCLMTDADITEGRIRRSQNKSDGMKDVPLHPYVAMVIELYREGDFLFSIDKGNKPNRSRIGGANTQANKWLKVAQQKCGISKRLHTHNSRHSYASQALDELVDDRHIQAAMGISDAVFKHYKGRLRPKTVDTSIGKVLDRFA